MPKLSEQEPADNSKHKKEFSMFYLKRAIVKSSFIALSPILLVEPLFSVPYEASKGKIFKKQMSNSIKVDGMGKSDVMAQKFADQKKTDASAQVLELKSWERDSYTKEGFVIGLINSINFDKKDATYSLYEKKINKIIKDLDLRADELISQGVPADVVNIIRDGSVTYFKEGILFLKIAYLNNDKEMIDAIISAINNKGVVDMSKFSGGYGWGNKYHINFNYNDSQLAIFARVVKQLKAEGYNIKNINWINVSLATFEQGNPLSGSDRPYGDVRRTDSGVEIPDSGGLGKFPNNYENNMKSLLEKNIESSKPQYEFSNLRHPGIDPQVGGTIPHENIRTSYKKTKEKIFDEIKNLMIKHPYLVYLLPDILADSTKHLNEGFNQYIKSVQFDSKTKTVSEISESVSKNFEKNMKLVNDYLYALTICVESIEKKVPEKLQQIKDVFDTKGKFRSFSSIYPLKISEISNFLDNQVNSGAILVEPQSQNNLNKLKVVIARAFLNSTLPGITGKVEYNLDENPWFIKIRFENQEKIRAEQGTNNSKQIDNFLNEKWNSMFLVPRNVLVPKFSEQNYDKNFDSVEFKGNILLYEFSSDKKTYIPINIKSSNIEIVFKPVYSTWEKETIGTLAPIIGQVSPSSDQIIINTNYWNRDYLEKTGWKYNNKSLVWRNNGEMIAFGGSALNFYPVGYLAGLPINIKRTKTISLVPNEDGTISFTFNLNPPSNRHTYLKIEPNVGLTPEMKKDNSSLYFKVGKKASPPVYAEGNSEPTVAVLPTNRVSYGNIFPIINSDLFHSIGANYNIDPTLMNAIYNKTNELLNAIQNGDITTSKYADLVGSVKEFTSAIYSQLITDPILSISDRTFLADFVNNPNNTDLTRWTDIVKKIDTGDLWKMIQGRIHAESDIKTSISFQTASFSLWKPLKVVGPVKFSSVIFGREIQETKGNVKISMVQLNPDGTYGAPTVSEKKINKTEISNLKGLRFDLDGKLNRFGSVDLIFGKTLFSASFKGAGDNIVDEVIRYYRGDKKFLDLLEIAPKASEIKCTDYKVGEEKFRSVSVETKLGRLSTIANLLYWGSFKKVYPVVDVDVSILFNWDKEKGFNYNNEQVLVLGTRLDFGKAEVYAKKEFGGEKTTTLSLVWNSPKLLGSGSKIAAYATLRPTGEMNQGITITVPFFNFNRTDKSKK